MQALSLSVLLQWHRPRLRGGSPFTPVDDGFGGIKSSCGQLLDLYPASRRALLALSDANVPVAIASRTHRAAWARQWLEMLRVEPGGRTTAEVIGSNPIVIQDGPKPLHLKEIQRRTVSPATAALPARPSSHALPRGPPLTTCLLSLFPALGLAARSPASGSRLTSCLCAVGQWQGVPLGSMLFFDDNLADVRAAARDGVTSVHCIAADRRRQRCVSPRHPAPSPPARRQPPPQSCAISRPHHPPGAGSLTPLFNKGCETTHSSPRRLRQRRSRSHVARRFARAEPRAGPAGVPAIASLVLA